MVREIVLRLIQDAKENAGVDFKREFYASLKHSDIAKDVAAFANLVNNEDKYIIFGVDDETREIIGIDPKKFTKQDDLDSYLEDKIEPFPMVDSGVITTDDGKTIGYIIVFSNNLNAPYVIKETCGKANRIEQGDIFIRKGSCNRKVSRADIDEMYMKNGQMKIRIHDEVTIVEPIHTNNDFNKSATYGHVDIEIFNDSIRPLLITGGEITIKCNKYIVTRSIWSTLPMKNIHDCPIEISAHTRKIYTMLYDFYSQDCVDMEFDVNGHIDSLVYVKVRLVDTDGNIYESDENEMLMKVKGDILHEVRLKVSNKKKAPSLLKNLISLWFRE